MRFALIGISVALTYICLYLALRSAGIAQVWANGLAFFQAVVLQYACQSAFTLHRPLPDTSHIVRFASMVSLGFLSSALITGPFATSLGMPDWKAAVSVTQIQNIQNYVLITFWVFAAPNTGPDARS